MQKETAQAVIFSAPGQVDIKPVPVDGDEGIFIRSELMGISSGTEMLFYRGTVPEGIDTDESLAALSGQLSYPIKYGYMNVGTTESGERRFAFYPHQDLFYARASDTVLLPDGMSPRDGVFLASMETAVGIVQDLGKGFRRRAGRLVCKFAGALPSLSRARRRGCLAGRHGATLLYAVVRAEGCDTPAWNLPHTVAFVCLSVGTG